MYYCAICCVGFGIGSRGIAVGQEKAHASCLREVSRSKLATFGWLLAGALSGAAFTIFCLLVLA